MTSHRLNPALLVLPGLFMAVLLVMRHNSLPFWQSFNLDPDYYYLLNGLRLVEGLAPTDVSHPGTPVQAFVALILKLMHLGSPAGAVVEAVLDAPERHLLAVTTAMYPLIGLALYALGRGFLAATGRIEAALLAQGAPFMSMLIPKFGLHPKPEGFLVIAVCLLLLACLRAARAPELTDRHAGWIGVALGFGIACKLHFLALGLVPLFILDRRRLLLVLPIATVAAFLVFVAPAIPSREIFFDWVWRNLTHAGAYGTGEQTVHFASLPRAVVKLFSAKLIMTAAFLAGWLALAAYARLRRRGLIEADPLAGLLAGMLLAQLATAVLIAKQPAAHYLVPALLLTGPELAVLWTLSRRVFPAAGHARGWAAIAVALAALQGVGVWKQNAELKRWSETTMAFDMGRFKACAKVDFDASSSLPYALQRGDMNAQGRYSPRLARRMPADTYTWFTNDHTWWNRGFMWWNQPRDPAAELAQYPCAVFRGNQDWSLRNEAARLIPGFAFDDRCEAGEDWLYTKGIKCSGEVLPPLAN